MAKHNIKNQIVQAIADRIIRAHKDGKKFRVIIVLPQKPEFAGGCSSNLNRNYTCACVYMGRKLYCIYHRSGKFHLIINLLKNFMVLNFCGFALSEK